MDLDTRAKKYNKERKGGYRIIEQFEGTLQMT